MTEVFKPAIEYSAMKANRAPIDTKDMCLPLLKSTSEHEK